MALASFSLAFLLEVYSSTKKELTSIEVLSILIGFGLKFIKVSFLNEK